MPNKFSHLPTTEWNFFELGFSDEKSVQRLDLQKITQDFDFQLQPRTRMLIVGGPGVGKTFFIIELCKKWSNRELLCGYKYVILLQANDPGIYKAENVEDVFPFATMYKKFISPIIHSGGKDTLFILEGYDELPEHQHSSGGLFYQFIQEKKLLPNTSLIVTTRPWCEHKISKCFSKKIEVLGFTYKGMQSYIAHSLKDDSKNFYNVIKKFPIIEGCVNIPFYLSILIEIYNEHKNHETDEFPNTMTKLYGALVRTVILQFAYSNERLKVYMDKKSVIIPPGEFFKLPKEIYTSFLKLCMISYRSVLMQEPLQLEDDCETFDLLCQHVVQHTWEVILSPVSSQ